MQFKIVHKGLFLISIPLFFELAVFGVLVRLELDAEQSAQRAIQARAISDGVNQIERDIHSVGKFLRGLSYQEALTADIKPYCSKLMVDVEHLQRITPDRPGYAELFARTKNAVRQGLTEIEQARDAIVNTPWAAYSIIKKLRKTIDTDLGEAISPQLLDLAEAFSHEDEEKRAEMARNRVRTFFVLCAARQSSYCVARCFLVHPKYIGTVDEALHRCGAVVSRAEDVAATGWFGRDCTTRPHLP